MSTPNPPLPRLPGGPDPNEPVPRTPVEGIDLAGYAAIVARLAGRQAPRAVTLARAGFDEARWLRIEQTWLLRLATAALQGDLSLGREHDETLAATQAAIAAERKLPL